MNLDKSYRILNLKRDAELQDVKRSFRRLAFSFHPDLHPDDPGASHKFQELNEAYITLCRHLEAQQQRRGKKTGASFRSADFTQSKRSRTSSDQTKSTYTSKEKAQSEYRKQQRQQDREKARSHKKETEDKGFHFQYQQEEEVLKDILNDPFAKKVFEDIFRTIKDNKTDQFSPAQKPRQKARKRQLTLHWGEKKIDLDLSRGPLTALKKWLSKQMDDEQTVYLPPSRLVPGNSIRLQIERRFSPTPHNVQITLPSDYVVGRPLRLKGMGRRMGPWKGDLYLRILAQ